MSGSTPLLSIDAITKKFGGVTALHDVSFDVQTDTVVGLIGPNGSGKTTLLNVINSVVPADSGDIRFRSTGIGGKRACDLAASGLSRTFQTTRVFSTLSVMQNLFVPLLHGSELQRAESTGRAHELLAFVGLERYGEHTASELSGGQQRLLEFARALVTRPRLVLMDEPFAGVHPEIKKTLVRCIRDTVKKEGASFVVVSHEVPDLLRMSDFIVCLVEGRVAAAGLPTDVVHNEQVIEGYLGRG
jgi:ABC-type branched-subunit amino acid transport system ATPase component